MAQRSLLSRIGAFLVAVIGVLALLVVELVTTIVVYSYLNLNHIEFFGWLVRMARSVLDVISGQVDFWLQASADTAYASVFGELGPKSMLLLLIGLVVGAVIRSILSVLRRLYQMGT